jgi:hypothetical protein
VDLHKCDRVILDVDQIGIGILESSEHRRRPHRWLIESKILRWRHNIAVADRPLRLSIVRATVPPPRQSATVGPLLTVSDRDAERLVSVVTSVPFIIVSAMF